MGALLIGWVRLGIQRWWAWALSGAITFLAGGLSETYLIPQNVAVTLALLLACLFGTRRAHLLAAFAGGVLALIVIVVAPSTATRVQGTPADLRLTLSASIATAYMQAYRLVRFFPFTVLLCLAAPTLALRGTLSNQREVGHARHRGRPDHSAVLLFPSFYAQNGNPPARSLIVPGALLVGYLLFAGWAVRGVAAPLVLGGPGARDRAGGRRAGSARGGRRDAAGPGQRVPLCGTVRRGGPADSRQPRRRRDRPDRPAAATQLRRGLRDV